MATRSKYPPMGTEPSFENQIASTTVEARINAPQMSVFRANVCLFDMEFSNSAVNHDLQPALTLLMFEYRSGKGSSRSQQLIVAVAGVVPVGRTLLRCGVDGHAQLVEGL